MQPSRPIDRNITLSSIQPCSTLHTSASRDSAELKEAIEYGTVISDIIFALLLSVLVHIVGGNFRKEIDVFVRVELTHLLLGRRLSAL